MGWVASQNSALVYISVCCRCVNCVCVICICKHQTFCTLVWSFDQYFIYIVYIVVCMYSSEGTLKTLLYGSIGYLLKSILSFAMGWLFSVAYLLAQIVDVLHLMELALSRDDPRLKQKCFMKPHLREPLFAHKKECKFFYSNNRVCPIIKEWRAANQKTKFDLCVSTASGRSAFKVQKCSKSQDSWWKSKYLRLI